MVGKKVEAGTFTKLSTREGEILDGEMGTPVYRDYFDPTKDH